MLLPKLLIYHRDNDRFVLFDNGDILDEIVLRAAN
ncbi:putative ORFan [Tupanvirus deep ocean]|uniref:ORFan n=2 Tax=Tupanvirus TaxID=2094720 RepID=A0AC62A9M9_9VIRU|nr:putative ORFan [Tupanvirus deep ocean]QKU34377.1 putative ORFan [Tupanvirus deep ocean]